MINIRYFSNLQSFRASEVIKGRHSTEKFIPHNLYPTINSHGKTVPWRHGLVLDAKFSIVIGRGNWWNWNVGCEILSAFCWHQNFDDLNLLSGFNLSKTRGRSAIFRKNYNLNTVITYGMTWNFLSLVNQTFWKRWWPQILISSALSVWNL